MKEIFDRLASRRMPIGAEVVPGEGVHFRVWASGRNVVEVVAETSGGSEAFALEAEGGGYFSGLVEKLGSGTLYSFRLDGGPALFPDPASRFQPHGPQGPSRIIDPDEFQWHDDQWMGINPEAPGGQVIYEMHIGAFTSEGTWNGAAQKLEELSTLGVTILEIMPVADFAGFFGWGYDGVNLFSPTRLYGEPDDMRRFVDCAHSAGLGVILDVVYNHLGPGSSLVNFSENYISKRHSSEWGNTLNFDDTDSEPVREFVVSNALYWIREFHLDGLRIDAVQQIFDDSREYIVAELVRRAREAALPRTLFIVGEDEPQDTSLLNPPEQGGCGLDALWNDDFHHSAFVAVTGRADAYYSDYRGSAQEFVSAARYGFLYQGQWYSWQRKRRGTPALDLLPRKAVHFLQNHDQIANSGRGERIDRLTSPGRFRAVTAMLLLGPQTPMLFQGQEFASSSPFFYFADHEGQTAKEVARGRAAFLSQFPALATGEMQARLADPADPETFAKSRIDHGERFLHREAYALHHDLLRLRREDPAFRKAGNTGNIDGAVLGCDAFVLRFFGEEEAQDRLLLCNLGRDLVLCPAPEPLLGLSKEFDWALLWSSEDPAYGGASTPPWPAEGGWRLSGETAVVLYPKPRSQVISE